MKKMWCALCILQHGLLEKLINMRLHYSRTLIETNRWLECVSLKNANISSDMFRQGYYQFPMLSGKRIGRTLARKI